MNRQDFFNRLDFQDDQAADKKVHPIPGIDPHVPVSDWKRDLPLVRDFAGLQFIADTALINGLQQSWPERRMHSERSINDLLRQPGVLGRRFNHLGAFASWR